MTSQNSSSAGRAKKTPAKTEAVATRKRSVLPAWVWLIVLPVWVYGVFMLVQYALGWFAGWLFDLGLPLDQMNPVTFTTLMSVLAYGLAIALVIWVPLKLWRARTTARELGVHDWPRWMDLALSVPAFVVANIAAVVLTAIAVSMFPDVIDLQQEQVLPFSTTMLGTSWHYFFAFVVMVVLAPIAEEVLFRGYLQGKIRAVMPAWVTIVVVGLVFGFAHLYAGPDQPLQWAVTLKTVSLGVILALLRESTGAIWSSVFVHMLNNGLAFYVLFFM